MVLVSVAALIIVEPATNDKTLVETVPNLILPEITPSLRIPPTTVLLEEILIAVWGKNDYFLGRSMDVFMSKVRKYLRADPEVVLETIHGTGYRFTVPVI